MEEDRRGITGDEPACGVIPAGYIGDREAEAAQGGGEIDQPVLLQGADPFGIIGQ